MKTRFVIAAFAVLGAGAALAGGHMKDADKDGDGFVSLDEMKTAHMARIEQHFAKMDADGDGLLSEAERKAAREQMRDSKKDRRKHKRDLRHDPEHIVEHLDVDGSGSVSLDEFAGGRFTPDAEGFIAADVDGSGELDAAELGELMATYHAERKADKAGKDRSYRN